MKRVKDIAAEIAAKDHPVDDDRRAIPAAKLFLTPDGREIPDPTPVAPPIGYKRQIPLFEQIRAMVRSEHLARAAEEAGMETFEESEDFEVGDDFDPQSPWENEFDPSVPEIREAIRVHNSAQETAERENRGGGGAEPPSAKPAEAAPKAADPPAKPPLEADK